MRPVKPAFMPATSSKAPSLQTCLSEHSLRWCGQVLLPCGPPNRASIAASDIPYQIKPFSRQVRRRLWFPGANSCEGAA
jgi:hypothetical protein